MPITTPTVAQGTAGQAAIAPPVMAEDSNTTLVRDQLNTVLNKGGALMQTAATQGNQGAASRGLLNSSMGIQAAQQAVIGAAGQIASADANALNQGSQFNAQQQNAISLDNAKRQDANSQFNTQQSNAMNQWNAGQQNEAIKQTLDINSRESLANIEANYKTLLQANSSASGMYEQYLKNISDISQSDKMDATAKQNAINNQISYLRSGMSMLQNMNGISGMITF
jgi:hypothetical protein